MGKLNGRPSNPSLSCKKHVHPIYQDLDFFVNPSMEDTEHISLHCVTLDFWGKKNPNKMRQQNEINLQDLKTATVGKNASWKFRNLVVAEIQVFKRLGLRKPRAVQRQDFIVSSKRQKRIVNQSFPC